MLTVIDYQLSQFKGHVIFHLTETVKNCFLEGKKSVRKTFEVKRLSMRFITKACNTILQATERAAACPAHVRLCV